MYMISQSMYEWTIDIADNVSQSFQFIRLNDRTTSIRKLERKAQNSWACKKDVKNMHTSSTINKNCGCTMHGHTSLKTKAVVNKISWMMQAFLDETHGTKQTYMKSQNAITV